MLRLGGGTEAYLAWSETALAPGTEIAVFSVRGERSVDVMQLPDGVGSNER
jgi:hypothetical protein